MQPLFSFDEIQKIDSKNWISIDNNAELCCINLIDIIANIKENNVIVFNSFGKFSLYNLVENIAEKMETQSKIWITTYGLSEPGIRKLSNLKFKNIVSELNCVLDFRVSNRQPKAFKLLRSIANKIGYAESHAKITVIENDHFSITILGSQNWTRNTKHEAGVVICSSLISNFYIQYIHEIIAKDEG